MKRIMMAFLLITGFTFSINAQICYAEMSTKDQVTVKYKWKTNKEGNQELRIKFKNKAKSAVNLDLELGYYLNGVMEEKVAIADCLKKSFIDNWFRQIHIVTSENLSKEQLMSEDLDVQVTEMKIEKIDECGETDS